MGDTYGRDISNWLPASWKKKKLPFCDSQHTLYLGNSSTVLHKFMRGQQSQSQPSSTKHRLFLDITKYR